MIRLISFLPRKSGTTHEEFLNHWLGVHGPLIANSSAARYVRRYEQYPARWPAGGGGEPEPEWDGVTIQDYDTVEDFWAQTREPDHAEMRADIARFLDVDRIAWVLVDEPSVVMNSAGR